MRFISIFLSCILLSITYSQQNWERRDGWQKTDEIIKAMNLSEGSLAADIGSKDGYLTVKLAQAVGNKGIVYAVDIDEKAFIDLQKNLDDRKIKNVTKSFKSDR